MTPLCPQLKARCEELKLDWSTLSLENLLKEKQALRTQISEKQRHCLELQVGLRPWGSRASRLAPSAEPGAVLRARTGRLLCCCGNSVDVPVSDPQRGAMGLASEGPHLLPECLRLH